MSLAKLIGGRFPPNKSEGGYRQRINLHRRVFTTRQQKYFTACASACAAVLTGAELNNSTDIGFETLAVSQSCDFFFFFFFFACNCNKMFICNVSCFVSCAHCCLLVVFLLRSAFDFERTRCGCITRAAGFLSDSGFRKSHSGAFFFFFISLKSQCA